MRFMLGVDEAGRGPLAGPVAVGVVMIPEEFDVAREFPGVADSKKLSEKKREEIFALLEARVALGDARFAVEFEDHQTIDSIGIVRAVRRCVSRGVNKLSSQVRTSDVLILLDGLLKAPPRYRQETIIGGDETVPIISLASIAAKVLRDRAMREFAEVHPIYSFERHKGYGTPQHYERLKKYGPCAIHRRSFLHLDKALQMR